MSEPLITRMLPVEVEATLGWRYVEPRTSRETFVPASEETLNNAGWRNERRMYERTREIIEQLGLNSSDGVGSHLRYFIEHVTHWDGVHDLDTADVQLLQTALLREASA